MVHHSSPHAWIKIFYNLLASKREISKLEVIGLSTILITSTSLVSVIRVGVYAQQQQQQPPPIIGIKITSPTTGQQVPVGELTISGISTDNSTTDCTVYAD